MHAATCNALRPKSATQRHLEDLCLPGAQVSPAERHLNGKVTMSLCDFSFDKPFKQKSPTEARRSPIVR